MEQKSQQVAAEQERRQGLLAMPTIVLHMIVFGLAHIVIVVFALPPRSARLRYLCDRLSRHMMISDKAVVIQLLARFGLDPRKVAPLYWQRIVATSEEDMVDIPIKRHFRKAAVPAASCQLFDGVIGLPKGQALLEGGMRLGLAHQDEVAPVL
jgi:hypothetical protein